MTTHEERDDPDEKARRRQDEIGGFLNAGERLAFLIGRVAQADVWLENSLRHLWVWLAGPGMSVYVVPNDFATLVEGCKVLIAHRDGLSDRLRTAGLDALVDAKAAHSERNRVVHDMWLPQLTEGDAPDPEAFVRQRYRRNDPFGISEPRTLRDVERALDELLRASMRITMLQFQVTPFPSVDDPAHAEMQIRIIEGRFDLGAGGGARAHDD